MNRFVFSVIVGVLGFVGMLYVVSATATEFYGYSGCDRAIDGAQKASSLAQAAADLPSDDVTRDRKWREAMHYNSACYDVARALCGSQGGFLRPPASAASIGLCKAVLDDNQDRMPQQIATSSAAPLGGGLYLATIDIRVGYDNSNDAVVSFVCAGQGGGCKSINLYGANTPLYTRAPSRGTDEKPGLKCKSGYLTFDATTVAALRTNVVLRGNIDESVMKCEFYAREPFRVTVTPPTAQ